MTDNRRLKADARSVAESLGIGYAEALSLVKRVRHADPGLRGQKLVSACRDAYHS